MATDATAETNEAILGSRIVFRSIAKLLTICSSIVGLISGYVIVYYLMSTLSNSEKSWSWWEILGED